MAQVLIQMRLVDAGADQTTIIARTCSNPGAPLKQTPLPRVPLPFRAINVPGRPGYDPGLQRHHLLPRQLLSKRCFGALFAAIGRERLRFDDFRGNGLMLPANDAAALRTGLPLHRGPHRQYNAIVIEHVGQVEARWSHVRRHLPLLAVSEAAAGLRLLQQALRGRLRDPGARRLALNRFDPLGQGVDFTQIDAMVDSLWPDSDPWVAPEPRVAPVALPMVAAHCAGPAGPAAKLACAC